MPRAQDAQSDHLHRAAPVFTSFDIDLEHALLTLRSCHLARRSTCAPAAVIQNARYLPERRDGLAVPSFAYFMALEH